MIILEAAVGQLFKNSMFWSRQIVPALGLHAAVPFRRAPNF